MIKRALFPLAVLLAAAQGCGGSIDCDQVTYGSCDVLFDAKEAAETEQEARDLERCYQDNCVDDAEADAE